MGSKKSGPRCLSHLSIPYFREELPPGACKSPSRLADDNGTPNSPFG